MAVVGWWTELRYSSSSGWMYVCVAGWVSESPPPPPSPPPPLTCYSAPCASHSPQRRASPARSLARGGRPGALQHCGERAPTTYYHRPAEGKTSWENLFGAYHANEYYYTIYIYIYKLSLHPLPSPPHPSYTPSPPPPLLSLSLYLSLSLSLARSPSLPPSLCRPLSLSLSLFSPLSH